MASARLVQVEAVVSQEASYLFDFTITYYLISAPGQYITHTFTGFEGVDFAGEFSAWATAENLQFL